MRYYIDTCIWIDFIDERHEVAHIFTDCVTRGDTILFSEILVKELGEHIKYEKMNMLITLLYAKELIEKIETNTGQEEEALSISKNRGVPFADSLHAILARDNDVTLVSRDKHFLKLKDICSVRLL